MLPKRILQECSEFLSSAECKPLYRTLSRNGEGFRRIKIRKRSRHKYKSEVYFDIAFEHKYKDLRLRSMVAQTATPSIIAPGDEIFYVFPPNGFRVLYNTQIDDYFDYINTLDNIIADSPDVNEDIVKDVIGDAYTETDLTNAFKNGSDVLIYNISYYYAIRESLLQNVIDK